MSKEIWKDIKGYEGLYQVSNLGRIKHLLYKNQYCIKNKEVILKGYKIQKGYIQVKLANNKGLSKCYLVHVLVLKTFMPNENTNLQVNHINGIKDDNRLENLEWCTPSENMKHSYKMKFHIPNIEVLRKNSKQREKKIIQLDKNNNFIKEWNSAEEVLKTLGIKHITEVCRNQRKTAGGYKWSYKEEYNGKIQ